MTALAIGWPQIIWIVLAGLSLGISCAKNGEPRGPYSAIGTLIGIILGCALLWWGGFFTA